MKDWHVQKRTGEIVIVEEASVWYKPWTWFATREITINPSNDLQQQIEKWRYLYHREHTKRRASERLGWTPSNDEYRELCQLITRGQARQMQSGRGETDELYEVEFKGRQFQARYDPDTQCVVTIIKESRDGPKLGNVEGFEELQEKIN